MPEGDKRPCTVCDTPTDTHLAIEGGTEWLIACLMAMGTPAREAKALVIYLANTTGAFGNGKLFANVKPFQAREVPPKVYTLVICTTCAAKANFQATAGVTAPCYRQPA